MNVEALPLAEEALHLSIKAENKEQEAKLLNSIGRIHKNLSNYPLALEYYNKALAINEQIGNKAGVAADTGNIGQVHINLSDFPRALEYHTRSLAINEEIGNKAGVAANSANIGIVYGNLSDLPRALEYMTKALTINEEVGNKLGVAMATGNIGNVYNGIPDYPRALEFYSKALAMDEDIGHKIGVARNTGNIGNVHYSLSNYPLALEYLTKALALTEEIGNKNGVANNNRDIGRLYGSKDFEGYNADKAEDYLLKAIYMYAEIGVKSFDVHKILAELYKSLGRWEEALAQFERYHELEKEVLSEEANKLAHQIETRRKIEEAERDAQLKLARFQGQEKILHNILPAKIAGRILEGEKQIADHCDNVSVFFSDIVGFTKLSAQVSPAQLVEMLNQLFTEFDRVARKYGLEKIKP
ncbi:MAG: tetratricopeptide repeat protein [Bacteroidetes bacterium]|nr:tetratricopeptide repeat protein [Bacteroidota bacterium]